ncbi:hypothetical protein BX666DRAFT_1881141 [Dichotomocladium elegans]|nr:hypothetical protein BX666DRAFT_1881141 [Dichotomocladium elegans]
MQRYFLRMGRDPIDNAKTVIDFISLQIQQKKKQLEQHLGIPCRPWVLVFASQMSLFQSALGPLQQDRDFWEQRQWLDGIRVCQVASIHELRAVLCALHLKGEASPQQEHQQEDIVTWIDNAHDGQPPCLIVVMDLLQLLSSPPTRSRESDGQQLERFRQQGNRDHDDYVNDACVQLRQVF